MSISNYSDLKSSVADWLARDDLTSRIPDFIKLAEQRIYRGCEAFQTFPKCPGLRIRAFEEDLDLTIASNVISIPDDYLELKYAYINTTPTYDLERKTPDWMYKNYPTRSGQGIPQFIAREHDTFIFGPAPDSTYNVKGIYYKSLPALSDSNTTNWLTDNAFGLLLFGALAEAGPFIMDDRATLLYESKYREKFNTIQADDLKEEYSGSILRTTCA